MDWYDSIFEVIDPRSFSNLWYWISLAVVWSSASHWVLGVPFDMVSRGRRLGGQADADLRDLVRINVGRLLWIGRQSGLLLMGFAFFLLTVLLLLGFVYRIELAQALVLILAPMSIVFALSFRTAAKVEALPPDTPDLYRLLSRHRVMVQGIGMVAIFVTAMWGMWQNLQAGVSGH